MPADRIVVNARVFHAYALDASAIIGTSVTLTVVDGRVGHRQEASG